jgi:hypothetical protein
MIIGTTSIEIEISLVKKPCHLTPTSTEISINLVKNYATWQLCDHFLVT